MEELCQAVDKAAIVLIELNGKIALHKILSHVYWCVWLHVGGLNGALKESRPIQRLPSSYSSPPQRTIDVHKRAEQQTSFDRRARQENV